MQKRPVVPLNCFFQGCYNPAFEAALRKCKNLCHRYNRLRPDALKKQRAILKKLLGKTGKEVTIVPPFRCDYGYAIEVGDFFFANHNLTVQDGGGVRFGDHVFIAPDCIFTTAEHALHPQLRQEGVEIAKPISVGNNVWIGAGAVVLAGVSIGDNSVIGAGSVVTKDIPANVVAAGVPCKILREITDDEKNAYPFFQGKY